MKLKSFQKNPGLIFVYTFGLIFVFLCFAWGVMHFFSGIPDAWILVLIALLGMAYVGSVIVVRMLLLWVFRFLGQISLQDRADMAKRGDLLGRLGLWYLDIQQNLYVQKKSLQEQQEAFLYFVGALKEPLCVLSVDGRLLLWNQAFVDVFGRIETKQFYWEVLAYKELKDFVQKCLDQQGESDREVVIHGHVFLCGASYNPERKEFILLFRDITKLYQLDKIKKDLVSNVSHELKTPLTAIKGFTDTLREEESDPSKQHYLSVIARHVDRLDRIIADLLLLSEVEQSAEVYQEDVHLKDLLQDVVEMFQKNADKKQLQLIIEVDDRVGVIRGDSFRLEQAMINLVDNAIKYTEQGFVKIKAYKKSSEDVVVEIEDSGVGIPQSDLSRIFERFYTVDKSHSRREGGTGLGLSIVKSILQQHHADIKLLSGSGKGTRVVIVFKNKANSFD